VKKPAMRKKMIRNNISQVVVLEKLIIF